VGLEKWSEEFECGHEDFVNGLGGESCYVVHCDFLMGIEVCGQGKQRCYA
jgi:hypothetical protein